MLLGIAPDAVEFEPYAAELYGENFGELRIRANRANTMRIFDGQHRRRAIQDTLERLNGDNGDTNRLVELQQSSVPIVLYAEEDIKALRLMFVDASKTKRIEANVVTRFDQRDAFNHAAMHLSHAGKLFGGRIEMERTTVARSGRSLLAVNQLAQILKTLSVGHDRRVSRDRNEEYLLDLEELYQSCLVWSDEFLPKARYEYDGLLSGEIGNDDIPSWRAHSLAYSATFIQILAGCYHNWCSEGADWKPLAEFVRTAALEPGGGRGNLLVDAGTMAPGGTSPIARRQEVAGAIRYIVQQAKSANL
jgi:DGQHR domain-containing protein